MVNSGEMKATSQIKKAAIIKPKRLRVIMRRGRVIKFKIGLAKALSVPKRTPAKSKVLKILSHSRALGKIGPIKLTPGTNLTANQRVIKAITICQNNLESIYLNTIKDLEGVNPALEKRKNDKSLW